MPITIIAEAGVNHNGSLEMAKEMARVAKAVSYTHLPAGVLILGGVGACHGKAVPGQILGLDLSLIHI